MRIILKGQPQTEPPSGAEKAVPPGTAGKLRILLVDDNADYIRALAEVLRSWDYRVEYAFNATAALAIAKDYRPRIVLVDLGLPDVDGYTLARQMRQQHTGRKIFFIVVTGAANVADQVSSSAARITHYLQKPVNHEALRNVLESYQGAEMANQTSPS